MDEVNNRLQKIEKAFKKQEENLEELRYQILFVGCLINI